MGVILNRWALTGCLALLFYTASGQVSGTPSDSIRRLIEIGNDLIGKRNYEQLVQLVQQGHSYLESRQSQVDFKYIADLQLLEGRLYLMTNQENKWDRIFTWTIENHSRFKSQEEIGILIRIYNNAGIAFKRLSRLTDSQEAYVRATEALTFLEQPDYLVQGSIYNNAGNALKQLGEYEKAINYFNQAVQSFDKETLKTDGSGQPSRAYSSKSQALNNLGLIYQSLGNHTEALAMLDESLRLKREYDEPGTSMVACNMAISLMEVNRLKEAEALANEVLMKYSRQNEIDRIWVQASIIQMDISLKLHRDTNRFFRESEQIVNQIKKNFPGSGDLISTVHLMKAELLQRQGRYQDGLRVVDQWMKDIGSTKSFEINELGIPDGFRTNLDKEFTSLMNLRSYLLLGLGGQNKDLKTKQTALHNFDFTARLIDSINRSLQDQSSKIELVRTQRTTFNGLIGLSYDLFKETSDSVYIELCFRYMERSKSAGLMSSILETDIKATRLPDAQLKEEQLLRTRIADITGQLLEARAASEPDPAEIAIFEQEKFGLSLSLDSLLRVFKREYPDYYNLKFESPVLRLEEAMGLLSPGQALLEYSLVGDRIFSILFDNKGVELYSTPLDPEMERQVIWLSEFVKGSQADFSREAQDGFVRTALGLFRAIIPQSPRLENCGLLTVIPEGIFSLIPFEILLTSEPANGSMDYRRLPYLLHSKTITYSYSATLLFYRSGRLAKPSRRILAVAPDYHLGHGEVSEFIRLHSGRMPALKGVVDEVRAIRRLSGGKILVGKRANEHVFRRLAPDFSILHLAMHTIPDEQEPMNTCLVFTPGTQGKDDGLLFAHELYNFSWNSSLTVLSACETGTGQLITGEGVLSLARGFMHAGCPNLIMTLWAVDDRSSQEVMELFYGRIWSGEKMADGLRKAKLRYLDSADKLHAHPHFWAGYVFLGNNDPATATPQPSPLWLGIPASMFLLALLVLILFTIRLVRKPRI